MGVGRNKQTPPFDYGKKEKSVNVPIHQYKNPPICKKEKEYMTSIIHRQEKHNVNLLLWLARLKKKDTQDNKSFATRSCTPIVISVRAPVFARADDASPRLPSFCHKRPICYAIPPPPHRV